MRVRSPEPEYRWHSRIAIFDSLRRISGSLRKRVDERCKGNRGRLQSMHHEQRRLVGIVRIEKINLRLPLHCGGPDHAHEAGLCKSCGAFFQPIASADWIARKLKPMTTKNDGAGSGSNLNSRSPEAR